MKKIMLGMLALTATHTMALDNINIYGKVGADVISRFSYMEITRHYMQAPKNTGRFSPSVFLEMTYNATPKIELGAGLGYIYRKGHYHSFKGQTDNGNGASVDVIESYQVNRYSSIPVYFLVKHNFTIEPNVKTYIKADFGHSFNRIKSNIKLHEAQDSAGNGQYRNEVDDVRLNVDNGNYYGIGFGVEYHNFLAEIAYAHTDATLTYTSQKIKGFNNYNNDALRFSIGYKF